LAVFGAASLVDRRLGRSTTGVLLLGVLSVPKHPVPEEEQVKSDEEIMIS
jgi:hypothetical protein